MSSILKALQRVEQERPPGASGAPRRALRGDFVAESGGAPPRRPKARRLGARLWGSLGVALLLGLFVWWRLPESSSAPEVEATPEAGAGALAEAPVASIPESAPRRAVEAEPAGEPEVAPAVVREARAPAPEAAPAVAPEAAPALAPEARPRPGGRRVRAAEALARAETSPSDPLPAAPQPEEANAEPVVPAEVAAHLPPLGATLEATAAEPVDAPAGAPQAAVAPEPAPAPRPEPSVARAAPRASTSAAEATSAASAAQPTSAPTPKVAAPEPAPPPAPPPAPQRPAVTQAPAPVAAVARPAPPPPKLPAVVVERTRWHPTPERRLAWVTVEGFVGVQEVGEGEAVGALVVKEIKPSSVVFLHGADTLSRRVGAAAQ